MQVLGTNHVDERLIKSDTLRPQVHPRLKGRWCLRGATEAAPSPVEELADVLPRPPVPELGGRVQEWYSTAGLLRATISLEHAVAEHEHPRCVVLGRCAFEKRDRGLLVFLDHLPR